MLSANRRKELNSICSSLGIKIKNLNLLNTALTHGSYIKEFSTKTLYDNERLEFFGDAVLKLCISEYLMSKYPNYLEGELSNLRAFVISEKVLAKIADSFNLGKYLLLGKNEKKQIPISILADAFEAIIAVIYYECGANYVKEFILNNWKDYIEFADKSKDKENFKAVLQEYSQGNKLGLPVYKTISEIGPEHKKLFDVAVYLDEKELARGKGKTKKEASQDAAKHALRYLKNSNSN